MLSKLILIKSCTYDLAEIDFSKGDSMQLVGGNNVGKSSLICALNFLFVINRNRMAFTGGRSGNKATMEYYFPEAEGSFLVFEISKKGRKHCLVVWRDGDGAPRYGRLSVAYSRERFFAIDSEHELQPQKLSQLRKQWLLSGAGLTEISQLKDIYQLVYQTGRSNDAVVSLKRNGSGKTADSFSQLYRYLINTQLINSRALQEILLLADHRDDAGINYGTSDLAEIEKLRRLSERTQLLIRQREAFENLRQGSQKLDGLEKTLQESLLRFNFHCTRARAQLEEDRGRHQQQLEEARLSLDEIKEALGASRVQLGRKSQSLTSTAREVGQLEQGIASIRALPPRDFLENCIENLTKQLEDITYRLKALHHAAESPEKIEKRLEDRTKQLANLQTQKETRGNWLVHHLSPDEGDRRRLNALLHPDVARADAGHLHRAITCTDGNVTLYDGAFVLPTLSERELPTPEALAIEIDDLIVLQQKEETLLETARNRQALEAEEQRLKRSLREQAEQLGYLQTLPENEENPCDLRTQQKQLNEKVLALQQLIKQQQEEERRKQGALDVLRDREKGRERKQQDITDMRRRVERFSIDTGNRELTLAEGEPPELGQVFHHLESTYSHWNTFQREVQGQFTLLRSELKSESADVSAFFIELDQEYAAVNDVSATMESLVDSIGKRFANPVADLLGKYTHFQDFVNQKFNRGLARLTISNIEQLRIELVPNRALQSDLENIGSLDLGGGQLFRADTPKLTLLQKYIERGSEIAFTDLFTLQLKLRINGKDKVVDLSKQVESDGTDRMLRLVIVMQAISRMAELDAGNRLVVFIDEIATIDGRNRPQLVEFCREHHFYPIFAAPEMVDGFDRYVMINRATDSSVVVVADKHYIDVERD